MFFFFDRQSDVLATVVFEQLAQLWRLSRAPYQYFRLCSLSRFSRFCPSVGARLRCKKLERGEDRSRAGLVQLPGFSTLASRSLFFIGFRLGVTRLLPECLRTAN